MLELCPAQLNVGNTANPSDAVTSFIYAALNAAGYNIKPGRPHTVDAYVNSTCRLTCAAYCKVRRRRNLALALMPEHVCHAANAAILLQVPGPAASFKHGRL